ncbi:MAG: hypothetical protein LBK99_03690 [Opitutaceae bacterium]|jgi:hypothetical protein|nr:hypothetical protein [Opitutaceae bacterium]
MSNTPLTTAATTAATAIENAVFANVVAGTDTSAGANKKLAQVPAITQFTPPPY